MTSRPRRTHHHRRGGWRAHAVFAAAALAICLPTLGPPALVAQPESFGPILVFGELRADDWTPIAGTVRLVPAVTNHEAADLLEQKALGRQTKPLAAASSGADGSFELVAPGPGLYWIQATAPGYATVQRNLQFLGTSRKIEPLRLPAGMVRTFTIEDGDGQPIEGAMLRVALSRERGKPSDAVVSSVGRSDARGRLDLELAVGDRRAQIDVVADGFVPGANRSISAEALRDEWSTITLVVGQAREVLVTVDGRPFEGARVLLEGGRLPVARTGEGGRATVWVPPQATVRSPMPLVAEAHGVHQHFGVAHRGDDASASTGPSAETVEVAATTQDVRGVVLDRSESPVAGAWVWTSAPFGDPVRADDQGRFALTVAGQYPTEDHRTNVHAALPGVETEMVHLGEHQRIVVDRQQGGLHIRVTDQDGAPVDGVRVTAAPDITRPDQARRFSTSGLPIAVTDTTGRAVLHLPTGELSFRLAARKPGYQQWDDVLPPEAPGQAAPRMLEIQLRPGAVQVGWVVDEQDVGIAGATVEAHRPNPQPHQQLLYAMDRGLTTLIASAVTDQDGRFEIRDAPPQKVRLEAEAPGFAPTEVAGVDLLEQDGELGTLVLVPGHAVDGIVLDEDGQPVVGVEVRVLSQPQRVMTFQRPEDEVAITDDAGHFSRVDLAAGSYSVSIRHQGYRDVHESIEVPLDEPMDIRLLRGVVVPVRITDAEREPLEYGWINWHESSPPRIGGQYDTINGHTQARGGTAEIYGLRPGTFALNVTGQNHRALDIELHVEPDGRLRTDHAQVRTDGRSLDIRMERGVSLRGTVRGPAGEPVTDLMLMRGNGSSRVQGSEYIFSGLAPGLFEVTFKAPGYAPHHAKIEIGNSDQVYDVTLDEGWTLEGTVVDRDSGAGIPAATIRLGPMGNSFWSREEDSATTDASGRFTLTGIGAGQFTATAQADGYAEGRVSPIDIDGPPGPITFELHRGSRVYGVVTGRDDQLQEVQIGLHLQTGQSYTTRPAFDGTYELRNVPAGTAHLTAGRQLGAGPYQVRLEIPEAGELEHDIEFGTNRITGTVLFDGQPMPGVAVGALASGQLVGGASGQTGADGRFELDGVSDGPTDVLVSRDNVPIARRNVEVLGDLDVTIEIELLRLTGRVVDSQGDPVPNAQVHASSGATSILDMRGGSATTDASGRFVLELPTDVDRFDLTAGAPGHPPVKARWSPGESTQMEFVLPPSGGTLEIQWTGTAPLFGSILISNAAGDVVHQGFGSPQQGWRVADVAIGDWTVWIQSGLVTLSQPVRVARDVDGNPSIVTFSWPTTGKVQLQETVAGLDWTGRTNFRLLDASGVEVRLPGGDQARSASYAQLFTGQPMDAPVGTWTLQRLEEGAVTASTTFTIEPGRVTQTSFDP